MALPNVKEPEKSAEPTMADLMRIVLAQNETIAALTKRVEAVPSLDAGYVQPFASKFARKPWEEEIYAEVLQDITYPDKDDPENYSVYRHGRKEGPDGKMKAGDIIRIQHREHLNDTLRELTGKEAGNIEDDEIQVPHTGARSQRKAYGKAALRRKSG